MRSDLRSSLSLISAVLLLPAALAGGCGRPESCGILLELTGDELRRRLPEEVAGAVAEGAVLCLDEPRSDGAYHLWILRHPGGTWLSFPPRRPGRRHPHETHEMPPSALESILRSRLPSLTTGNLREPRCRLTHWRSADGAEIQVRELITDQGWFASVERVAM